MSDTTVTEVIKIDAVKLIASQSSITVALNNFVVDEADCKHGQWVEVAHERYLVEYNDGDEMAKNVLSDSSEILIVDHRHRGGQDMTNYCEHAAISKSINEVAGMLIHQLPIIIATIHGLEQLQHLPTASI